MFRWLVPAFLCTSMIAFGMEAASLPAGNAPPALEIPHLPSRLHAFVWRNWESVNLESMAGVLGATREQVAELGASMGLPEHQEVSADQWARNYIAIIRRNWHLLPYDQLLVLLDWNADQLAYALKEDDFLWHKLGKHKPACAPLIYAPPDADARARAGEIREQLRARFGDAMHRPGEARFAFVERLSQVPRDAAATAAIPPSETDNSADESIRFLYSYFAVFGDPLIDETVDPYPDGLLHRLRQVGVNGVWLHVCYRQLAPAKDFPEFGEGWQARLANLRKLVERAKRYGIKVYLYTNEPRAMPASFYLTRPEMKGAPEQDFYAMCTSDPRVLAWLTEATRHVFREVPGLGGAFTISASENLTNCWSRGSVQHCPRCSKRAPAEVIAEVNRAIADGVRAGDPQARTIIWDWAWHNDWCEAIINQLPKDAYFMSVSEWDLSINRGGVPATVGEYSLSAVGPGPRAQRNWEFARKAGLRTMAKIQANCTWELSALPYLPVMDLVGRHGEGLAKCQVNGMMLSWTLGGYPSPNLELVDRLSRRPAPPVAEVLEELADKRFGARAARPAMAAWSMFSTSFSEFPYHGTFIYGGPMQIGPANLLFGKPTGYGATMVGYPYDDITTWRAVYPAEVLAGQLRAVATGWQDGLKIWEDVQQSAETAEHKQHAAEDGAIARAAWIHFASAANQTEFYIARNALLADPPPANAAELREKMRALAADEIRLAVMMFGLTRADSRIGYEASNHYYYLPLDMMEKVINCEHIIRTLRP